MACCWDYGRLIFWLCLASFLLGLTLLMPIMLALYASPLTPSFSINLFDDQAFNVTSVDNTKNLTIPFHLRLKNQNFAIGLHYPKPLKITFSYFPNVSMMVFLAEYKIDSFYQGNRKTKNVRDMVVTDGLPMALEGTDMVAFRVDLVGVFRYTKTRTKRHKVDVGCVVGVNYTTSQKMLYGFIELAKPGLDSQLKPPPKDDDGAFH